MTETKIEIKTEEYFADLPIIEGETVSSENAINIFLADTLTEAGIDSEMIYQDTDTFLVVRGVKVYLQTFFVIGNDPIQSLIKAVQFLSDELNGSDHLESWYSYAKGKHYLTIKDRPPMQAEVTKE